MGKKKSLSNEAEAAESEPEIGIEEAMDELGQIVARLEAGQQSLEESLQQFERGMRLLRTCHRQLDAAAQRIEIVTAMAEGQDPRTEDFDATSTIERSQRNAAADSVRRDQSGSTEPGNLF